MAEYQFRSSEVTWFPIIRNGSDLGSNFDHSDGYLYFLFGDTPSVRGNPDPIGMTNAGYPGPNGLTLEMLPGFLKIEGIRQEDYEVPTGGFSTGDRLNVFFTTDHYQEGDANKMGRCVLANARFPTQTFQVHVEVDSMPRFGGVGKFINVCPRVINAAEYPELPSWLHGNVLMWASGDYMKSDVYLACASLDKFTETFRGSKSGWTYYTGDPSPYDWRDEPESAKPLLGLGAGNGFVGELSVGFIPGIQQWIMLCGGGLNPITARCFMAPMPWGPWTPIPTATPGILSLCDGRPNGAFTQTRIAPYGFYIIDRYTRWDPATAKATLWFPVSENEDRGTDGIYCTHLVRLVLQYEEITPPSLPHAKLEIFPDTIKSGEHATATISLDAPFIGDLDFDVHIYYPGASDLHADTNRVLIKAGQTTALVRLEAESRTGTFRAYTSQIEVHYTSPSLPGLEAGTAAQITINPSVVAGILNSLRLSSNTVTAGGTVDGLVTLDEPVDTPTNVSLTARDAGGGIVNSGTSNAVSMDEIVTVPKGATGAHFQIHVNTMSNDRDVTIFAYAVYEKRAHLTVLGRG